MRAFVALAVLSGVLASCATDDELIASRDRKYNEAQAKIAGLERQVDQLESQRVAAERDLDSERARAAAADAERARLAAENDRLRNAPVPVAPAVSSNPSDFDVRTLASGDVVMTLDTTVTFASGSAVITEEGQRLLSGPVMAEIRKRPELLVSIEGHADDQGLKPELREQIGDNTNLSLARALAVRRFFAEKRLVPESNVRIVGYGEHRPKRPGSNEAARAHNRRVEIVLLKKN